MTQRSAISRVAIYARVSTDRQREKETIQSQLHLLPKHAAAQGWVVVDTYIDDGCSGETVEHRPAFQRLLDDARSHRFDALLVIDLDRITRSKRSAEGAVIYDHFREHGVKLATPGQGVIDLDDEDQDLLAGFKRELSKWEKRKILSRMTRGKRDAARRNKRYGSQDPYGYRWATDGNSPSGGQYQIVEPEAAVVRRIYSMAADDGLGIALITARLNLEGFRTRPRLRNKKALSGRWSTSTIGKILHSTTYRGEFLVFKKSDPVVIRVPPIVDAATWNRAQSATKARRPEVRWKHDHKYLLSGIASCGLCGYAMWVVPPKQGKKGFAYYRCASTNGWRKMGMEGPCGNKHHRVDRIDDAVWEELVKVLRDAALLAEACSLSVANEGAGVDWESQLRSATNKLRHLDTLVTEVNQRRRRGLITAEHCDQELGEIARERALVDRNVELAKEQIHQTKNAGQRIASMQEQAARLAERIEAASFEERRELVRLVFPREHGCSVRLHASGRIEMRGILHLTDEAPVPLSIASAATSSHRSQLK